MNAKIFKKALVCLTLAIPFATSSNYCTEINNLNNENIKKELLSINNIEESTPVNNNIKNDNIDENSNNMTPISDSYMMDNKQVNVIKESNKEEKKEEEKKNEQVNENNEIEENAKGIDETSLMELSEYLLNKVGETEITEKKNEDKENNNDEIEQMEKKEEMTEENKIKENSEPVDQENVEHTEEQIEESQPQNKIIEEKENESDYEEKKIDENITGYESGEQMQKPKQTITIIKNSDKNALEKENKIKEINSDYEGEDTSNINQINISKENDNYEKMSSNKIVENLNEEIYNTYAKYLPKENSKGQQKDILFYSEGDNSAIFKQPSAPNGIDQISVKYLLDKITEAGINLSYNDQLKKFISYYIKFIQMHCIKAAKLCETSCNVEENIEKMEKNFLSISFADYQSWIKNFNHAQINVLVGDYQKEIEQSHKENVSRYSKFNDLAQYLQQNGTIGSAYVEVEDLYTMLMQEWAKYLYNDVIQSLLVIYQAFKRNDFSSATDVIKALADRNTELIKYSEKLEDRLISWNYLMRSFKIWRDVIHKAKENQSVLFDSILNSMYMHGNANNYQFSQYDK